VRSFHRSAQIFHAVFLCLILLIPLLRGAWDQWAQSLVLVTWAFLGGLESLLLVRGRAAALDDWFETLRVAGPPVGIFVGAGALSAVRSAFPNSVWPAVLNDLPAVAFFFLTAAAPSRLRPLYWRSLAGGAVLPLAAAGVAAFSSREQFAHSLINANLLACLAVAALPLVAYLGWGSLTGPRERWGWRAAAVVSVAALILSKSFWGFVVFAATSVVAVGGWMRGRPRRQRWAVAVVAVAVVSALAFAFREDWGKIVSGDADRWAWWRAAFAMVTARPLLGVGPGAFGEAYPAFRTAAWGLNTLYAHNLVLEMAAERGLLGLGAFLAFAVLLIRRGGGPSPRRRALGLSAAAFGTFNLVNFGFSFPALYWLSFAGAGLYWAEAKSTEAPPRWTTHRRLGLAGVVLFAGAGFASYALFRSGQCVERARIEFESGRWPAAREWVDRGLRWNRWNPELYDLGAALRLVARDVDGAARDLDRCVGLAPTSAGFRRDAAELALRRSRPEEALAHYDAAVRFLPLSPVPWVRRGDLLRSLGRLADAEASYRSALRALADPRVMAGAPDTRAALTTQVNAKLAEVLP